MDWHALVAQYGPQILSEVLPVLGTAVGSLLAYGLWHALGLIKNQQVRGLAQRAVAFAEQRLDTNDAKLGYVRNFLKTQLGNKVSDEELDHFIEEAVLGLKQTLKADITASTLETSAQPATSTTALPPTLE